MEYDEKTKAAQDLIYLVSCAMNSEKPDKQKCDEMDLAAVYGLALRHSLCAVAAAALERVCVLPEDFREAKYKAVRRQSLFNIERAKVLEALERKKIWYLPLKGIVLRNYYPKTSLREMGDNDILCDGSKTTEIKAVMEDLGFECLHFGNNNHDVYEKPPMLDFEMHRSLFARTHHPEQYEYYENIKEKLIKDESNRYGYHMTNEDFYIYLICHMRNHYKSRGTGLRSLLDVYVFYRRFGSDLDRAYVDPELEKLGILEFEQGVRDLAFKVYDRRALSRSELDELGFFIRSGSHGTLDNMMMQRLGNDDSGKAKRRYAVSRLFPPKEYVKINHPFIYRHMALYPLWVVYRPFKGAVRYPKKMFGEIRRLKNYKKKNSSGKYNK